MSAASDRETVYRSCPLCEAHCGVAVEVDRAAQQVVTVRGDAEDPFSRGYICPKAYAMKGLHEDPDRLRRPLRRRGTDWEEISWDEAFAETAAGLDRVREKHGANGLATYLGNPNAHDLGSILYGPALQRALGTRWRFSATSVDQLPKMVSSCLMFGGPAMFAIPDVDRTDFMLVLGANPLASNGSLMTAPDMPGRLRALRQRGGRLVVVDPRRSETAQIADQHLFIRPGTDAHFLFSLVHVLFAEDRVALGRLETITRGVDSLRSLALEFSPERTAALTGVPAETVRTLAREFAAAERAVCYGRIGTCTQAFGSLASWLVDALNVLTGNLDRPGGALFPRPASGPASEEPRRRGRIPYARWRSRVRSLPEFAGELPVIALAEEIDTPGEGQVRGLLTVAGNPVLSTPNGARLDRALEGLEFMASVDIYLNETTRHADVILPPTSILERSNYDLVFTGVGVRNFAKWSPAVFEAPEDSRSQWEILAEIAGRANGADARAVDELMLAGVLSVTVGKPGTACPDVSEADARKALGDQPGPERLLDLMLRAGPRGDRFDPDSDGLSLARLRAETHGMDLGALEPRLPAILATESGAIELAPELLVEDVERLRADLARGRNGELLLIGRRHLRNNNSWMHNVHALAKGKPRCTLLVHPDDAARLGLEDGAAAQVTSRVGRVETPVTVSDEVMPGVVSLPHGFGHDVPGARLRVAAERQPGVNSNLLADEEGFDALSGNAILNGIPVQVAPAPR